jgi:cytochrome c553
MSKLKLIEGFFRDALGGAMLAVVLSASAQAAAPAAEPVAAPKTPPPIVTQVCAGCHGLDGNGTAPANPKLAGQSEQYLMRQLQGFRIKEGGTAAERQNPLMAGFAMMLTPDTMREVAAYYAAQKFQPSAARNKELAVAGQKIYRAGIAAKNIPACSGCHGPSGAGIPVQYPRVGGQYAEYVAAQLVAFRQGTRKNSAQMSAIAARMSDAEISATAEYIAGLR